MTPIEAAVKAGRERRWHTSYGLLQFSSIDARAIIRAFLEAAAEDERHLDAMCDAMRGAFCEVHSDGAKAAILALKETL